MARGWRGNHFLQLAWTGWNYHVDFRDAGVSGNASRISGHEGAAKQTVG